MVRFFARNLLLAAVPLVLPQPLFSAPDPQLLIAGADDHYYNLEHDEAIRGYYAAMEATGPTADLWNRIATTILYKELNRLGLLDTSAFKGDNDFLLQEKPKPDPKEKSRFKGALIEARRLAEKRLSRDPKETAALLELSQNYALDANYSFMVEKAYVGALRAGNKARSYSDRLRKIDPDVVDAYLVAGVQEYVVGGLPWALRAVIAIGGIRGDKDRGRGWVEYVAEEGDLLNVEARMLLALLYRREHRPQDAAELLEKLIAEYPRNYVLRLELASMYLDAEDPEKGLRILLDADRMVRHNEHRHARMPQRMRDALSRKIESVQKELNEPGC